MEFKIKLMADTQPLRTQGLMFAEPLENDEVAFFAFPYAARHAFWNKNVGFKLSLAFLNDVGQIVDFADMDADDPTMVAPKKEARYVVEASGGTFRTIGAEVGDVLEYKHGRLFHKKSHSEGGSVK